MINYLNLFISPSKALDKLDENKPSPLTLYILWTISAFGMTMPQFANSQQISVLGDAAILLYIILFPIMYFPLTYGSGYLLWIFGKAFKGQSSFIQMRTLIVYSYIPFILQSVLSIPFMIIGFIKDDLKIFAHENYLSGLILWLISFRILMVGIAKYNKFNWTITIITWILATSLLGGLAYLRILLKS